MIDLFDNYEFAQRISFLNKILAENDLIKSRSKDCLLTPIEGMSNIELQEAFTEVREAVIANAKDDGEEAAYTLEKSLIHTITLKAPIKQF